MADHIEPGCCNPSLLKNDTAKHEERAQRFAILIERDPKKATSPAADFMFDADLFYLRQKAEIYQRNLTGCEKIRDFIIPHIESNLLQYSPPPLPNLTLVQAQDAVYTS